MRAFEAGVVGSDCVLHGGVSSIFASPQHLVPSSKCASKCASRFSMPSSIIDRGARAEVKPTMDQSLGFEVVIPENRAVATLRLGPCDV